MEVVLVFLGAAIGAPLRYLTDRFIQTRHDTVFPWGTFTINVSGSFVLGVLTGLGSLFPGSFILLLGTGLCGAYTTFSTFSYETFRLLKDKAYFYALMNMLISLVAGVGAALLGHLISGGNG